MSDQNVSAPGSAVASVEASSLHDLRLRGGWLALARIACGAAMLLCLAVVVGSIPVDLTLFQTVCAGDSCIASQQLTASNAQALGHLGLSVSAYGVLSLGLTLLIGGIWFVVALVILWRKSDEWMALLVALTLVSQGTNSISNPVPTGSFALGVPGAALKLCWLRADFPGHFAFS